MSELDAGETLGKKVGPLPVAGWIAAVGGGLGIAWYLRRNGMSPDAADVTTDPGTSTTSGTGGAAVSDPYGPATDGLDDTGDTTVTPAISTNAQWRIAAVKYLIGLNVAGTSAEKAVAAYFSGAKLTATQGVWINQVLAGIGPTPAPVPPILIATTGTSVSTHPISNDGNYHPPVPGVGTKPGPATATMPPRTNTEWAPHAIWWLEHHGNYGKGMSHTAAANCVHTYLAGRALTQHQADEIKAVNAGYRPPPHPLPIKLTHTALTALTAAPTDARRDTGTL